MNFSFIDDMHGTYRSGYYNCLKRDDAIIKNSVMDQDSVGSGTFVLRDPDRGLDPDPNRMTKVPIDTEIKLSIWFPLLKMLVHKVVTLWASVVDRDPDSDPDPVGSETFSRIRKNHSGSG